MPAKRRKAPPSTNGNLEQAMALLIQNQAAFMSAFLSSQARSDERFSRIEERLYQIERLIINLPEAVREKIGFKARG